MKLINCEACLKPMCIYFAFADSVASIDTTDSDSSLCFQKTDYPFFEWIWNQAYDNKRTMNEFYEFKEKYETKL